MTAPIELIRGDITGLEVDAIVNAANHAWWVTVASRKVGNGPTCKHDVGRLKGCAI